MLCDSISPRCGCAAQATARKENKLIFLDLYTEWCGWCKKLQRDTFPSTEGKKALEHFVVLTIKTQERNGTPTEDNPLEKQFKVEGYPTLIVLDADGVEVARNPGYLPPVEFADWLHKVRRGWLETQGKK